MSPENFDFVSLITCLSSELIFSTTFLESCFISSSLIVDSRVSEITVFLGITSQEGFSSIFRSITILIAAIGLVLTPIYLLSMCRRVFFGPRIPALATVKEMNGRELTIGFSLLLPTLVIGFWPKIAINLYESSLSYRACLNLGSRT